MNDGRRINKLALLVGGGPAPGINGVISAVTIEANNNDIETIGFRDGFKYLVEGSDKQIIPLSIDTVKGVAARGGAMLGTSRTNPTKPPEQMQRVLDAIHRLGVDAVVTIGGD